MNVVWANDDDSQTTTQVNLSAKREQFAGMVTEPARRVAIQAETLVYGKALSSEALLALHQRYQINLSEQASTQALLTQLARNTERQAQLYAQGVSSQRLLQEQQAQRQSQQALLRTQQVQQQAIIQEARLLWGDTLSAWLLNPESRALQTLFSGKTTLLEIIVPTELRVKPKTVIAVSANGQRQSADNAELISLAPQNNSGLQGKAYFLQVSSERIRAGMAISAWLSSDTQDSAVSIARSALLWRGEQAIVYVKTAEGKFEARPLTNFVYLPNQFIASDALHEGEQIVIRGGQQLLSEQSRQHIPDEDAD